MSNLVIVAIPAEDDYVMQISSEKVPHLTLLYLGDAETVDNLEEIVKFVEHASTLIEPFYMDTDYRGTLGADDADVIFFEKGWDYKMVESYRDQLKQNPAVKAAYNSAEQHPGEWLPHLTLGYPDTPAKEIEKDHRLYTVRFDRIAVWDGDFAGPEFRLKRKVPSYDLVMSEVPAAESALEHYGIRGMKWGVRGRNKSAEGLMTLGTSKPAVKAGIVDAKWLKSNVRNHGMAMGKVDKKVFDSANKSMKSDVKALNKKPEYNGRAAKQSLKQWDSPLRKQHEREHTDIFIKHMQIAAEKHLDPSKKDIISPSGNWQKNFTISKNGDWMVGIKKTGRVQHAIDGEFVLNMTARPVRDNNGHIVNVIPVDGAIAQSEEFYVDGLMHYGIKGMRWGVRNDTSGTSSGATKVTALRGGVHPAAQTAVGGVKSRITPSGRHDRQQAVREQKFQTQDVQYRATIDKRGTRRIETQGGRGHEPAPEAVNASVLNQQRKASGIHTLSNQQLQELSTRLNLEQNVTRLTAQPDTGVKAFLMKHLGDPKNRKQNAAVYADVNSILGGKLPLAAKVAAVAGTGKKK
jgi:2'-5' RNA ligase